MRRGGFASIAVVAFAVCAAFAAHGRFCIRASALDLLASFQQVATQRTGPDAFWAAFQQRWDI